MELYFFRGVSGYQFLYEDTSLLKNQKQPKRKTFGSLAVCYKQTHNFAPPPHDGFAISGFFTTNMTTNGCLMTISYYTLSVRISSP
jgi:hypothetical protein